MPTPRKAFHNSLQPWRPVRLHTPPDLRSLLFVSTPAAFHGRHPLRCRRLPLLSAQVCAPSPSIFLPSVFGAPSVPLLLVSFLAPLRLASIANEPLKAALLINYDPSGPSRLLSTIAEQEGVKLSPIEITQLINFVKLNKLQTETFLIGPNEYMVTSIHENFFHARCLNTPNLAGEGVIVGQTSMFLLVAQYEGSVGAASNAVASVDQFANMLGRKSL